MGTKKKIILSVDLQCGSCGSLYHRSERTPRFCANCGAAYERSCIKCRSRVDMYFEEYWPTEGECVRTYTPAKRCPQCSARLEAAPRAETKSSSAYEH